MAANILLNNAYILILKNIPTLFNSKRNSIVFPSQECGACPYKMSDQSVFQLKHLLSTVLYTLIRF